MRVRVTKAAVVNRHTQTTYGAGELTAPIHLGELSTRPAAPTTRWQRLRALWERLRSGRRAPARRAPEVRTGTLVQFLRWNSDGSMDYNPFPKTADDAIDYDRPLVVLLDQKGPHGEDLWYTSPVYSVSIGRYGLPSRVETRSSLYEIEWIETPVLPIEDVAEE